MQGPVASTSNSQRRTWVALFSCPFPLICLYLEVNSVFNWIVTKRGGGGGGSGTPVTPSGSALVLYKQPFPSAKSDQRLFLFSHFAYITNVIFLFL